MARGGFRAGAGRPKKSGLGKTRTKAVSKPVKSSPDMLPLDYMLAVMRDEAANEARRDKMAVAAAAYIHEKAAEKKLGKKEQQAQKAREAQDVFSGTRLMPRLVVDND